MKGSITAKVFRYDPDRDKAPYFKKYRIGLDEKISVMMLLNLIHRELDQTLSFRHYCCGLQLCRSCLMRINRKRKYACLTQVEPGEELVIEPATYPDDHIKDLVVKMKE